MADFELMAKEYYMTHKRELSSAASVDLSHILVSTQEAADGSKRSDKDAKALIEKISSQLQLDPQKWDELVNLYSEDPGSRNKGGQYLAVTPGKMVKPFEDTAFALKRIGEISKPVKTQFGYHIIRLDAKNPATIPSFEDVKDDLVAAQRKRYNTTTTTEFISNINTSAPLVIPDCAIEEMMERYFDNPGVSKTYSECLSKKSSE